MNTAAVTFQKILDALLSEDKDFPRHYLQEFSDIGTDELQNLLDVWLRIKPSRKLTLLEELKSLADADTLVSFDDLARALLTDSDPNVRVHAIRLLDESEDTKLISTFLDMLKNDPDVNVRAEAANALNLFVDLGELEEIPEKTYHEIEDALLASVNGEDDVRVRRAVLESLGYSSRPEVATLIESAFHREDPHWQASALIAMGRSADDRWEEDVTASLISDDERVKRAAAQAAGELSIRSARPILLKMLGAEEDADVTSAAIWSLSQIGGEDVRTYLENLLDQTEDEEQIEFLEEALDNLAFTEDLDRFELLAIDPDEVDEPNDFDNDEDDEKE
ncbi:MAG: HEAT repeat domain-containing protein [Anaerolineae bacterium]|nr:HEAT repeat domain-containing protein [Anaerolineae bacterium]MCI0611057.1 HEAT repeat domain-containing protein [Anaerolineae bacterium]